jgi:acetylornithine deacetylase/succinyl-diaminopimelate desuccinylase-like protein
MRAVDERLATMFEPMLGVTFTPTRIEASEKINVIPSRAQLKVDCRVPPGLGEEEVRAGIAEVLGEESEAPWRIDFIERIVGNRSPIESQLMDAISTWISERDPGAATVPTILPGFTDSRHFRAAFPECVAYGFFPHRHQSLLETAPLIHGADERIDVRDLAFAAEFFRDLAQRILG